MLICPSFSLELNPRKWADGVKYVWKIDENMDRNLGNYVTRWMVGWC